MNQGCNENLEGIAAELEQPATIALALNNVAHESPQESEQNARARKRLHKKLARKRGLTFSAGDPGGSGIFKKQKSAASATVPAHKPESCGAVKGMGERLGHLSEAAESVFENSNEELQEGAQDKQDDH